MTTDVDRRLVRYLDAVGADGLLSADAGIVRMLTGHAPAVGFQISPLATPAFVLASRSSSPILICSADEADAGPSTVTYEGFTTGLADPTGRPQAALREALERTTLYDRKVALDGYTIPSELSQIAPMGQPAGGEIAMLAAIKTPDEVEAIHAAVALCDAGHRAARDAAMEGATELEIWNHVHVAVAQRAGEPVVMLGDLLTGARTELIGGPPTDRTVGAGDAVLVDIATRLGGMWSDSCASWTVGKPRAAQRRAHAAVSTALEIGLRALGPTVTAGHVDAVVRGAVADAGFAYPHHTGHGVGFTAHEFPGSSRTAPLGLNRAW